MTVDPVAVEAELGALLYDFWASYEIGANDENYGLVKRLYDQHLDPPQRSDDVHVSGFKPGSRPPGDTNALSLAEEISDAVGYWTSEVHPVGVRPILGDCLKLLPSLACGHEMAERVLFDMRSLHRRSLFALGLEDPPIPLRGVPCPVCGEQMLRRDPARPELGIWCASSGPDGCHNDEWSECRDECPSCGSERRPWCQTCQGRPRLLCRRSPGSLRHAMRWGNAQLDELVRSAAA